VDKNKEELIWEYISVMLKALRLGSGLSGVSPEDKIATMLQLQALIFLKDNPGLTIGEFAKELNTSQSSVPLTGRQGLHCWIFSWPIWCIGLTGSNIPLVRQYVVIFRLPSKCQFPSYRPGQHWQNRNRFRGARQPLYGGPNKFS